MDKFCRFLSKILAIYRDTGVFCLSITGTENFQYRPLLVEKAQSFGIVEFSYLYIS